MPKKLVDALGRATKPDAAYELSTLTGTQVMLLVASETGHVYTYATKKLQPMISSDTGKALIQTCLNAPGDGSDLQPNRTEFTFETGTAPPNPRKRRVADSSDTTVSGDVTTY
ncbi:SRF-type transcription factor [Teladorsagia circumcincta]|uniref:Serum response factor homolog n=1 Tax=Teladorsagia circumcincta TaxID=45464 RepID=A0A2G9U5E4_TELCI|nr:SRF-type transcription factor [Teladorsagia circumcincta]